jgi:hypothetical protein
MYTNNYKENPCVRLELSIANLRHFIDQYALNFNKEAYEGIVSYDLEDKQLMGLHHKNNELHDLFFRDFNFEKYLNLLYLKRRAFKYEGEARFILSDGKNKNDLFIGIPWCNVLFTVMLPPECDNNVSYEVSDILNRNLELCKEQYPIYYSTKPNIVPCDIYTEYRKRIVIEAVE